MEWTKVSGKRLLQLRGFQSTFILQEKCAQYWPSERSARWETSFFSVCIFFSYFFLLCRYQYFVVDPLAEYNMPQYILREFKVTKNCLFSILYIFTWEWAEWDMKYENELRERVLISLETEVILKWHPGFWPPLVTRERQETIKDINGFQIPGPGTSNHFGTKILNGITYFGCAYTTQP